ncbi:MAG: DUF2867 domain-containing protein [Fimbriimonadales bacterium]
MRATKRVLVTGATGYVGGRLVPRLLQQGYRVRVLVRDPGRLVYRNWYDLVEIFPGDLAKPETLAPALEGVDVAYYLVHSMGAGVDFEARDRQNALNFAQQANRSGLQHCIYLGGLVPREGMPSKHLASRAEVGQILREHLPCTEFRAGPIIGSGSASFEMVRYLTERLPVMVTPRWIDRLVSPIGIRDVLSYLIQSAEREPLSVVEIGAEPLTFREMMTCYAEERGLKRVIFRTPVLAPRLAALWVGLVTPIPNRLAVPLVEGIVHSLVADTERARALFPEIEPMSYRHAVRLALLRIQEQAVETHWSGALGNAVTYHMEDWEGMICEERTVWTPYSSEAVYRAFCSLGGDTGWLVWNWAWRLRGAIDKLLGGPGLRRGRRHPLEVLPGEAIDFWRVEQVVPNRLLRLRAEMKVPGKAWLEFEALQEDGGTRLFQRAWFEPKGLAGVLYWYMLYPIHRVIFSQMAHAVARRAERFTEPATEVQPYKGP